MPDAPPSSEGEPVSLRDLLPGDEPAPSSDGELVSMRDLEIVRAELAKAGKPGAAPASTKPASSSTPSAKAAAKEDDDDGWDFVALAPPIDTKPEPAPTTSPSPGAKPPSTSAAKTATSAAKTAGARELTPTPAVTVAKVLAASSKPAPKIVVTTAPAEKAMQPKRADATPAKVTSKPLETTPKAAGVTPKPSATMARPVATSAKPVAMPARSTATSASATGTTPKPTGITPKPAGTTPKPTGTTPKPAGTTPARVTSKAPDTSASTTPADATEDADAPPLSAPPSSRLDDLAALGALRDAETAPKRPIDDALFGLGGGLFGASAPATAPIAPFLVDEAPIPTSEEVSIDVLLDDAASSPGDAPAPVLAAPDLSKLATAEPAKGRAAARAPDAPEPVRVSAAPVTQRSASSDEAPRARRALAPIVVVGASLMLVGAFFATRGSGPSPSAATSASAAIDRVGAPAAVADSRDPEPASAASAEPTPAPSSSATPSSVAANDDAPAKTEAKSARSSASPEPAHAGAKAAADAPTERAPADHGKRADDAAPAAPAAAPIALPQAEFDVHAAQSALAVAAGEAARCRAEGEPTGGAKVSVTFAPSGRVTSATVSGGPFAGTKTGGCIAGAFRRARVPAFDGSPVTVHKSIAIR